MTARSMALVFAPFSCLLPAAYGHRRRPSAGGEDEVESREPAAVRVAHPHHQRGVEDGVAPVFGAVWEVELGRERWLARGLDLHVDVPRPTGVLGGHNGFETVAARLVG